VRLRRLLCLAALLPVALSAGCGGVGISGAASPIGDQLTIYSSLPLQGVSAPVSRQIEAGEKLALAQAGGRVGRLRISYYSLDDSSATTGEWDPGTTATDAKTAAQDNSTIAYLGDYNSGATAISLPIINAASIAQVSPASPYIGLTSSLDAGQDEPGRFYLTGRRSFVRLEPGDPVEAAAQVKLMRSLGVTRLYILHDLDPFQLPLSELVATDAERAGIAVKGDDGLDTAAGTNFPGEVSKVVESGAEAVFFSGGTELGAVDLWKELYGADAQLRLFGPSTMVNPSFTAEIGAAAQNTFLTTPVLARSLYPPSAQRLFAQYEAAFKERATPYALYGYEAMSLVLAAIRAAGPRGNDRQTVIDRLLATRDRNSVLGRYSVDPEGETSFSRYGVDRVHAGRPVFWRELDVHLGQG
jgi:branched-chain amino acid transport system substrate-binding protein